MPKLTYKAALAHTFGRGGNRPFRTAIARLAGLSLGSLSLGLLFAWTARELALSPPTHPNLMFFSCVLVVQIVIIVTLLSSSGVLSDDNDTFARWLKSLPLGAVHRSILLMLPTLILTVLALLLVAWPLGVLMNLLNTPPLLVVAGVIVGAASGFGLVRGLPANIGIRLGCIAALVWVEYKLCAVLNSQRDINHGAAAAFGLLLAGLVGLSVYAVAQRGKHVPSPSRSSTVHTAWAAPMFWPVKQLLRKKSMLLSLGVGLLLSAGLAVTAQRQGLADPEMLGLLGALLAGSFASDIRALARRHRPAEITALRGTPHFVAAYIGVAYLFGLLIALPLAWSLHMSVPLHFVTQVSLGISIGLLAGTLIVPETRDIMSQFLAVILMLALLVGLPQLPVIGQLPAQGRVIADIGFMLLCLVGSVGIESKRNTYRWRNTHHAQ